MFDDGDSEFLIETTSNISNILTLLECRRELLSQGLAASDMMKVLDDLLAMEMTILHLDTKRVYASVLATANKEAAKEAAKSGNKVVALKKEK